jgi:hypothetical protein
MDYDAYRRAAFARKLDSAGKCLGVPSSQVVSVKVRDDAAGHYEYAGLLDELIALPGGHLREEAAPGEFQGRAHMVSAGEERIILVEHETGLEVLYIAGSVASLLSLVPLILQAWGALRQRHRGHRPHGDVGHVEIRHIDEQGRLVETRIPVMSHIGSPLAVFEHHLRMQEERIAGLERRLEHLSSLVLQVHDGVRQQGEDVGALKGAVQMQSDLGTGVQQSVEELRAAVAEMQAGRRSRRRQAA